MKHPDTQPSPSNDPEGSIFLSKIREEWFAALLGRGTGAELSEDKKWEIYERYKKERDTKLGSLATKAL